MDVPTPSRTPSPPKTAGPLIAVLWPAFLAACALELVVFASFDPAEFLAFGQGSLSEMAVLSIAFFVFWAICAVAGWITLRLSTPDDR